MILISVIGRLSSPLSHIPMSKPSLYLPSTVGNGPPNAQSDLSAVLASQHASLRHNCWRDNKHFLGSRSQKLHENHLAFLEEVAQEMDAMGRSGSLRLAHCVPFLNATFRDVLDGVCLT